MNINPDIVTRIEWEPKNDKPGFMKAFDDLVTGPLQMVHIERMHDGTYWMALYKNDKERQVVVISSHNNRAKIIARTEVQ